MIHPELQIFKLFLSYEAYLKYRNYVDEQDFSKELVVILKAIDSWYTNNTVNLSPESLGVELYKFSIRDKEFYVSILENLKTIELQENIFSLLDNFKKAKICRELANTAFEASTGNKPFEKVLEIVDRLDRTEEELQVDFVSEDLDSILDNQVLKQGLRWRLPCLNKSAGSLRKGDFVTIFARPEVGKTSFLASEVSFMAKQTDLPILWFNNEEQGSKVMFRLYQASLGATKEKLLEKRDKAKQLFLQKTGNRVKIIDSPVINKKLVETLCKQYNPSLIVFDQLDKITGFNADRYDLIMGAVYQWARELAKTYCPVIGVCQAEGSAENVDWLNMGHMANSKTAKAAEADLIIGIGAKSDVGYEYNRYLSICKNKLSGDADTDEKLRHGKFEVLIEPSIARYREIVPEYNTH